MRSPACETRWFQRFLLTLMTLVGVELDVLCNPYSAVELHRFICHDGCDSSASREHRAFADGSSSSQCDCTCESDTGNLESGSRLSTPPDIDDLVAPLSKHEAPHVDGLWLAAVLSGVCSDGVHLFASYVPVDAQSSPLHQLCRMRC